jgi:putative transposase
MPDYRRNWVPGGTYFFMVNLLERSSDLLVAEIELLRRVVRRVRAERPFHIDAWVVLPDHMHCVWTLPAEDSDYSGRWRSIRKGFSLATPATEFRSASRIARGERGVWQRRYWEHTVRDQTDYARHVDYVHFNPVKHGLVETASEWPFSSFHLAVAAGAYPADWGGCGDVPGIWGEREEGRREVRAEAGGEVIGVAK